LNFWDTWCTACVQELPDFNQFKAEYPQVDVIAVVPERADVIPWMNRKDYQKFTPGVDWTEWVISFTMYNAEERDLYALLGGKGALPMTVIVDGNGVIVFNKEGSMHLKDLKEIVEPLIND
jgi:thiol-disulfide isomerase/thioredoxin